LRACADGGGGGGQYGGGPILGPGPPIQKGRTAAGPPGSNLFIFHVPNETTNADVFAMFSRFGNVISARIMIERETGRSRGFG
jgi:CUG-BP- and ETR3-like factor